MSTPLPALLPSPSSVAAAPPFLCTLNTGGTRAAWVHVAGELDLVTSPQLASTLWEAKPHARLVVLDMRQVTFTDSSGVHVLLDTTRDFEREGCRLMVVPGHAVARMLALSHASRQIATFDLSPNEPSPSLHLVE